MKPQVHRYAFLKSFNVIVLGEVHSNHKNDTKIIVHLNEYFFIWNDMNFRQYT